MFYYFSGVLNLAPLEFIPDSPNSCLGSYQTWPNWKCSNCQLIYYHCCCYLLDYKINIFLLLLLKIHVIQQRKDGSIGSISAGWNFMTNHIEKHCFQCEKHTPGCKFDCYQQSRTPWSPRQILVNCGPVLSLIDNTRQTLSLLSKSVNVTFRILKFESGESRPCCILKFGTSWSREP